tara:strand:+ start:19 stop:285 length:267 start_codon:yes stop_codon:yes gene_type:complete
MKFELKTENEKFSKSFSNVARIFSILVQIIILLNVSLKLGTISRHYQIDYFCRLLSFEQSNSSFKKLSRLTNLKSKQGIWEFCRKVLN